MLVFVGRCDYWSTFLCVFFLMIRRPPISTRTDTLFPYTTLFRSDVITALSLVSSGLGIALGVNSVRNLRIPGVTYVRFDEEDAATFDLCLINRAEIGRAHV